MQYLATIAFALWCSLALVYVVQADSQEVEEAQLYGFDHIGGMVGGIVRTLDEIRSHPRASARDALRAGHRAFKDILDSSLGLRIAAAVFRSRACKSDGGRTAFNCLRAEQDLGQVTTVVGQVVRCCMPKPRSDPRTLLRKPWRPNTIPWTPVRNPRKVTVNAIIAKPINVPKPTRKIVAKPADPRKPLGPRKLVPQAKGNRKAATRPANPRKPTPQPIRRVVTRPANVPKGKPIPVIMAKPKRMSTNKAIVSKKVKPYPKNGRLAGPVYKERIPEATRVVPTRRIPLTRYRVIRYANPRFYSGIRPFGWPNNGVYYRGRFSSGVW